MFYERTERPYFMGPCHKAEVQLINCQKELVISDIQTWKKLLTKLLGMFFCGL